MEVHTAGKQLRFVVDTGASATVLDLRLASRLGARLGAIEPVQGVHSRQQARRLHGFSAHVAGVPLPGNILALDLSAASRAVGYRIDGLLGADFLHGRIVQLDFSGRALRFLSSAPDAPGAEVLPMRRINAAYSVPVRVNGGRPQWVRLDTGCTEALQWVNAAAATEPGGKAGVTVGVASSRARLNHVGLRLGAGREYPVRAAIHARSIFPGESGLLGQKFLGRFRVTVDAIAQRVVLEGR